MNERRRGYQAAATQTLRALGAIKLRMSVFVRCELEAGARRSRSPERELERIAQLAEFMEVVFPQADFASRCGEIEYALRTRGEMIPTMDLLIGTHCVCSGEPILTSDGHYERIPGLRAIRFDQTQSGSAG